MSTTVQTFIVDPYGRYPKAQKYTVPKEVVDNNKKMQLSKYQKSWKKEVVYNRFKLGEITKEEMESQIAVIEGRPPTNNIFYVENNCNKVTETIAEIPAPTDVIVEAVPEASSGELKTDPKCKTKKGRGK